MAWRTLVSVIRLRTSHLDGITGDLLFNQAAQLVGKAFRVVIDASEVQTADGHGLMSLTRLVDWLDETGVALVNVTPSLKARLRTITPTELPARFASVERALTAFELIDAIRTPAAAEPVPYTN